MGTAFYLMVRGHTQGLSPLATGAGGVLLGLVPLAKLQAVPLAGVQGAVWVGLLLLAWRRGAPQSAARLAYLQHVVAVHTLAEAEHLEPVDPPPAWAGAYGGRHQPVHTDVLVFRQPHHG